MYMSEGYMDSHHCCEKCFPAKMHCGFRDEIPYCGIYIHVYSSLRQIEFEKVTTSVAAAGNQKHTFYHFNMWTNAGCSL